MEETMQNGTRPKEEAKSEKTLATPNRSEALGKSKKGAADLPEDELSKISGGIAKPSRESY
jgi:hypothetical protein